MIPYTLHQLWFTETPLPEKVIKWRYSWTSNNPTWSCKLWSIEDVLKLDLPKSIRFVLNHPGIHYTLKTDIARYAVLFFKGGVYADTDMECLRPMDEFLNNTSFVGIGHAPDAVGNSIIGTVPGNKAILDIGIAVATKIICNIEEANRTIVDAGVRVACTMLNAAIDKKYPAHYFYPITWQQKKNNVVVSIKESYCVHHWSSLDEGGWARETILKNENQKAQLPKMNEPQIIPKVIHRCWFGNKPIPYDTLGYIEKDKLLNTGYRVQLWLTSYIRKFYSSMLPGSVVMLEDDRLNPVVKSDVLRYELLRLFGGFYADTDLEIFQNLDPLLSLPFVCADEGFGNVGTAFVGAIPYHPVCRAMLDAIWSNYQKNGPPKNAHQQMHFGGPNLFTQVLKGFPSVVPFQKELFYPTRQRAPATIHYFAGCMTSEGWTKKMRGK